MCLKHCRKVKQTSDHLLGCVSPNLTTFVQLHCCPEDNRCRANARLTVATCERNLASEFDRTVLVELGLMRACEFLDGVGLMHA
jgi:hypothetical protein